MATTSPKSKEELSSSDKNNNQNSNGNNSLGFIKVHSLDSKDIDEIHQVCLPPRVTTFQKLKNKLHEIFFPDDPLYIFKNQTRRKKWILGIQYFIPIFSWAPSYNLKLFRSDLVAGITIASLAIPQVKPFVLIFFFLFLF